MFDQREQHHRQRTEVQAIHLTQEQDLRAHHLKMKRTAKLSVLVKTFQVKETEREQASLIKTEKLLASQAGEAKQLLVAQIRALPEMKKMTVSGLACPLFCPFFSTRKYRF